MTLYSIVAAMGAVVLIYLLSALSPLPWYLYPPFIALFILAYFWEKIIIILRRAVRSGRIDKERGSVVKNGTQQGRRI